MFILIDVHTNPLRHIHKDQIEDDLWNIPAENRKFGLMVVDLKTLEVL
ncbi:hypothetical protein [Bartonella machadoae]|nr:hypothetical protein [Bartonella machadoae]UNE54146.1 hypothetical protein LNM86_11550 [Bartonella machadoae]